VKSLFAELYVLLEGPRRAKVKRATKRGNRLAGKAFYLIDHQERSPHRHKLSHAADDSNLDAIGNGDREKLLQIYESDVPR
jgi:hypothetical protein